MAEEIVYTWDRPTALVEDIYIRETEGAPLSSMKDKVIAFPQSITTNAFDFMDANQNRVAFPISLVVDRKFIQTFNDDGTVATAIDSDTLMELLASMDDQGRQMVLRYLLDPKGK